MRILVDADAIPQPIKNILLRAARRVQGPVLFVANNPLTLEPLPNVSSLVVPSGPDEADDRIVELAGPGDLVITADIPLADRVVAGGASAINPRGEMYTEQNIKDRLALRDLMNELRDSGIVRGGPGTFSRKDRQAFANQLDSFLTRHSGTKTSTAGKGE